MVPHTLSPNFLSTFSFQKISKNRQIFENRDLKNVSLEAGNFFESAWSILRKLGQRGGIYKNILYPPPPRKGMLIRHFLICNTAGTFAFRLICHSYWLG